MFTVEEACSCLLSTNKGQNMVSNYQMEKLNLRDSKGHKVPSSQVRKDSKV